MAKKLNGRSGGRSRAAKKGRSRPKVVQTDIEDSARTASPAQNELNLPKKRDLMHHYKTLEGSLAQIASAQAHHRNYVKAAQEAGIDTKAMLAALRFQNKDDLAVRMYFKQLSAIFAETGSPVQLSIFEPKFGNAVEQAKVEGFAAGKDGSPSASRFPDGSPEDDAYQSAWTDGQRELMNGGDSASV